MTVLRSREVVSPTDGKRVPKTTGNGGLEPSTPKKTLEVLNQQSNCTTPRTNPAGGIIDAKQIGSRSGSKSGSLTGSVRRRSSRLAAKSGEGLYEDVENHKILNQNGMDVDFKEEEDCYNGFDSGSSENKGVGGGKNRVLHLRMKKVKVSDKVGVKIVNVENTAALSIEEVKVKSEEVISHDAVASPGQKGECVSDERKSKGKRKLSTEVELLGSETKENEKKCLSLRSGKRVSRRGAEGMSVNLGAHFAAAEGNNGEKEIQGVECKTEVNGESFKGLEADQSEANLNETAYLKSRSKLSREEKAKGKLVEDPSLVMDGAVENTSAISIADKALEIPQLGETLDVKPVDRDLVKVGSQTGAKTRARLSRADKGKEKLSDTGVATRARLSRVDKVEENLAENDCLPALNELTEHDSGKMTEAGVSNAVRSADEREQITETNVTANTDRRGFRERFRELAKRNASRFAHFSAQEEENHVDDVAAGETSQSVDDMVTEDWPGPFSTAMKIIKDREMNSKAQQKNSSSGKSEDMPFTWVPQKDPQLNWQKFVPSLQELCLPVIVKNADAITSLDCIPDIIKHKLCQLLCDSRKMTSQFLELLVCGSPTEIRLWECSWLTEEIFERIFQGCDTSNLAVLQLDQCGSCLPDYMVSGTLARSPSNLPALSTISLKGAYRLSDIGLSALVSSAPSLRSINLNQCSLLTSDGISSLADSLGSVLKELYIDDCQGINAMQILPALLKLQKLEVLSLAGIRTVCDNFVKKFVTACGHNLKELVLKDCSDVTDSSLKVIAESCSGLYALDLGNLSKLTDAAIGYLANGCRAIHRLKLCRNLFSDEAIAAYLETSGETLKELSLNHVHKVGNHTAVSLAKCSKNLLNLDLSWCRNLSNEALGLIVDSCLSLKKLKLFGCTQITEVFINGHSNPHVRIVGLKMTPLLQHVKDPDFLQGPLRYS